MIDDNEYEIKYNKLDKQINEVINFESLLSIIGNDSLNKADVVIIEILESLLNKSVEEDNNYKYKETIFENIEKFKELESFLYNFIELFKNSKHFFNFINNKSEKIKMLKEILQYLKLNLNKQSKNKGLSEKTKIAIFKDILPYLNFNFLQDVLNLIDFNEFVDKNVDLICDYFNMIINDDNFKSEIIFKYFDLFLLNDNNFSQIKVTFSAMFKDKILNNLNKDALFEKIIKKLQLFNLVKHFLIIFPDYNLKAVNYYLNINETKFAGSIINNQPHLFDLDVLNIVKAQAKKKAFHFHYNKFKDKVIDLCMIMDYYYLDEEMLSYLADYLINDMYFIECLNLLLRFEFKPKLSEMRIKQLKQFLINKFLDESKENERYTYNNSNIELENLNEKEFFLFFIENFNLILNFEDYFLPKDINIHLQLNEDVEVIFINNAADFYKIKDSDLFAIDSEWTPNSCNLDDSNKTAILQIASEKQVVVFDIFSLNKNLLFYEYFNKFYNNKKLLTFEFTNDVKNMNAELKEFFNKNKFNIIDLSVLYNQKFKKKTLSLSKICKEMLGKELCKFQQMSNWEYRPLRLRQLHYAALDARILLDLYKILK